MDLGEALVAIIQGFKLIGDGLTALIQIILSVFGFQVPEVIMRLIMLGLLALFAWRYGKLIPKLLMLVIAFIFLSTLIGLLLPS